MNNISTAFDESCKALDPQSASLMHPHEAIAASAFFSIIFEEDFYTDSITLSSNNQSDGCDSSIDMDFAGTTRDLRFASQSQGAPAFGVLSGMLSSLALADIFAEQLDQADVNMKDAKSPKDLLLLMTLEQRGAVRERLLAELEVVGVTYDSETKTLTYQGKVSDLSPVYVRAGDYKL